MTRIRPRPSRGLTLLLALLACAAFVRPAAAAHHPGPPIGIARTSGPITIDGDLSDAGWQGVTPVTTWFETRVGDNVEPQVKNVAYLAYDDEFLYAAFRFDDPNPSAIRAPLGDHDQLSGSTDYGGILVDCRDDGKTAQMFLANPRGLQYDALSNDVSGEDSSPDYFWDCAGKITPTGWNLEIRVPFSSLRYSGAGTPTWGILLYRNYPRDRHYQFFSAKIPRDVSCFICNSSPLTGLSGLPHGSHLVVAPFSTSRREDEALAGLGQPLHNGDVKFDGGGDLKWNPTASAAIDATINPDFSQVESDAAQVTANERFALFVSEKRPFFLEGVDLLSLPLQAVYTRTITDPSAGGRITGKSGSTAYTALYAHDKGGGSVILPGPFGSGFSDGQLPADVGVFRVRRDLGRSFVSVLGTTRELDGGRYNRVFGPDFLWRPSKNDYVTGQALWSDTNTPVRTDLAYEWDGRRLQDHAFLANYNHATDKLDVYFQGQEIGDDFRADDGFIPQVGYREAYFQGGTTIRPKKAFFSRVRLFTVNYVDWATAADQDVLDDRASVGAGADGRWGTFFRVELNRDEFLVAPGLRLQRFRPRYYVEASPGSFFNFVSVDVNTGGEVDFANARQARGTTISTNLTLRPGPHLETAILATRRWLNVDAAGGRDARLFLADIDRVRATWMFNARAFVRLIGQYEKTTRDLSLYGQPQYYSSHVADFTSSALFAYKLNWQTVLYAGYGDAREYLAPTDRLEKAGRQAFTKISYAWQK